MNTERFIARRIIFGSENKNQLSRPVMRVSVLGIALGIALMILTVAVITGFQGEIRNKLIGFGSHIQITNYDDNVSDEPQPISSEQPFLTELKADPDIKHVEVYATKSGIIKTKKDNEGVLLKGIGADYDWQFINQNLVNGKVFSVSDTGLSKNIVISKLLADKLELSVNDKMVVYFLTKKTDSSDNISYEQRVKTFFVSGIYNTGFEDIDQRLVLVDIGQIRKLNYWDKDLIGGFEVAINDYKKIDEVGDRVDDMVGQSFVAQTIKKTNPTIFSWLDLQDMNGVIVITLMILVAGINMISALLILILERTNMIGILKALGAKNKSIQKIFLYNAVYLIGKGLFWGNILGIGIALVQQHFGLFTLDAKTYYISVIPISLNFVNILLLNVGTLVCCLLMLILPSFFVSRITPVKAIRFS
ncbi:MAG: putative transrane permease [Bacteroidetes bacterium]|nr:putative transrane permease [Bacteroidota bacterium]